MNQVKLVLNIAGLDPSGIDVYSNSINTALVNNTNFPIAKTYLPILATAKTDLHNAIIETVPSALKIKNKVKRVVKVLLLIKSTAEFEANDDEVKAISSGFMIKQSTILKPKVFNATQGPNTGTVLLECVYAGSRASYVWEYVTDPINPSDWKQLKVTNNATYTASGLTPGIKYWFRVKAIIKDEDQPYEDPHMVHVV